MKVRVVKQRDLYDENFEYLVEVHYPENKYNGWKLVAAAYDLKLATKIKKLIEEESK
jgi:hypothetical protein